MADFQTAWAAVDHAKNGEPASVELRPLLQQVRSLSLLATLAILSVFTATAQVQARDCRLPDDIIGEWEWKQQSDSDAVPHGRFSFETELNGKATLLRFQWFWPKDKNPRQELFVIHAKAQGEAKQATYFDEQGRESDCTVDVSTSRCALTIRCAAAVPPKYEFIVRSQDEMILGFSIPPPAMRGNPSAWFTGVAHRLRAPKEPEP